MARALLCCGCDALRDVERAFCGNCNEATDSYTPEDFGDEVLFVNGTGSYLGAVRSPILMGFVREASTGLIHLGDERAAA